MGHVPCCPPALPKYLVLKVVFAQVAGLSSAAVPMGQSPLLGVGVGKAVTSCPCPSGCPAAALPWGAARPLTRLSSRFATMEANLRSPASSEMRKTYSGAETWLDLWVRPEGREGSQGPAAEGREARGGAAWAGAHRTAGWHGQRSRAAQASCGPGAAGSGRGGQLGGRCRSWRPQR